MSRVFADLNVGDRAAAERLVSEADVVGFAQVSGDVNPVHLDEAYAATTPFKTRIAHGMLTASHVSALIANALPGPGSVYLSQSLAFKRPVRLGDNVVSEVEITALDAGKSHVVLTTRCLVGGKVVLEGEARVLFTAAPEGAKAPT
jgi:3-hydroxybutyryl-CoA dehydratase